MKQTKFWIKSNHWLLTKIIYPIIIISFALLILFFLGQIGGYNPCPIGEHESESYSRFGDSVCIPN
jgi:hypothetical protein